MSAALVVFEIWTVGGGAVLAGCLLRLQPLTVAILTPGMVGLVLAAQAVA